MERSEEVGTESSEECSSQTTIAPEEGRSDLKGSIIIAVLESYEVVRRQLRLFEFLFEGRDDLELILVDDGSRPPIEGVCGKPSIRHFRYLQTRDYRPWSQPCARNAGASIARGEYFLFTDIDHILTPAAMEALYRFDGDKMHFQRMYALLGESGQIIRNHPLLLEYGCPEKDLDVVSSHENTFIIRAELFWELAGYDSRFCGKYGGDDTDFNRRYGELHRRGIAKRSERGPMIYVYPDPRRDVKRLFHSLRW